MTLDDLPAVGAIERVAFEPGWPATLEKELRNNGAARYVVVEEDGEAVAFGGLWLQFDQAHIVTVAVDPGRRRRGFGRLVVHGLLEVAASLGMRDATLEVRESNAAARALYRAYGFYEVGKRVRYYADNGEDAVIMTTEAFETRAFQDRLARLRQALADRFGPEVVAMLDGERLAAGRA
jgi:ribosomal-protein-alanine N-acetyltransferase